MKIEAEVNKNSYLSFILDNELFAIEVKSVLEVLEMQKITRVPQTPSHIKGVTNFRGEILPVIDSRIKFNMPIVTIQSNFVIIVLDLQYKGKPMLLGAVVDSVSDVLEIAPEQIKPVPEMGSKYNTDYLEGMYKLNDDFIMILKVEKVFSVDELSIYAQAN